MLEEKILNDYKQAMKDKDALKSSVLSFLRAELLNTVIAKKKKALDDNEIIAVVRKQVKQRQDSIEQFTKGGRVDLADKETKELAILKSYLPKELSADQIQKIIEEVVLSTGAGGIKDMGKVIKEVLAKVGASADSKVVSDLVRQRFTKPAS
ncbi:MAG: GatB/YqeY domain-containing protein [Candidatus Omnitrophota bacterium]|nr:GatB/YqeY domain-containing protein [Candidatus Omnitrophota bacterium]